VSDVRIHESLGSQEPPRGEPHGTTGGIPAVHDYNLYCLTCGYNLRGLSGDPIRCPECGNLNPVGDVELPAPIIDRQLRNMETAPTVCVAAVLFGLPSVAWSVRLLVAAVRHGYSLDGVIFLGTTGVLCAIVWTASMVVFRKSCVGKPGWGGVLLHYHLYGLLLCSLVVAWAVAGSWLLSEGALPYGGNRMRILEAACGLGLWITLILTLFLRLRGFHRRLTEPMRVLQREVAVTVARDAMRRRMVHPRRGSEGS